MAQLDLFGLPTVKNVKNKEITHEAKSYTGLYGLHKYWGKKPYNIISDFIKKYTNEEEIVLDPFLGSGVAISEAVFTNRKGLGIDINPSATFITEQILSPVNPNSILNEFHSIEKDVKEEINNFYIVKRNGEVYTGQNFLWENSKLTEIRYSNGSRKRFSIPPEESDLNLIDTFNIYDIKDFYPKNTFFHNSRINTNGKKNVSELFSPRNLKALSLLYDRIENINDLKIKNIFKFCFTSSIGQSSKMVFVIKRRNKTKNNDQYMPSTKKEIGSWVIGYWTPKDYFENNVWTSFETRFKKILKAKKEQYSKLKLYKSGTSFQELLNNANYLVINKPSQVFLSDIPDNSIDYIITDPPHGNRIPYLELSLLWNGWLKKDVDYQNEIIISEAKNRNKNIGNYNFLLNEVLSQCFRVLKHGKRISFMFNSLDDNSWINVVSTFHSLGFSLEVIETMGYSANSVVQDNRKNGLQTDFIITYIKPEINSINKSKLEIIDITNREKYLNSIINMKNDGFKPFQIINNIICDLLHKNLFIKISKLVEVIENA